tara:strand:+ start:4891 stop:5919 length:1029 start_codon:yes stop_codon:yes gene_type:complete
MPLVNQTSVNDRHNRPSVLSRVLLRSFFIDDGIPRNPYAIRSVHIFNKNDHIAPNTVLGEDGLISEEGAEKSLMVFGPAAEDGETLTASNFDEDSYTGEVNPAPTEGQQDITNVGTSGIYNLGKKVGEYGVVLDGFNAGNISGVDRVNQFIVQNTASSTAKYIDVWTVKFSPNSDWQVVINDFELFADTFVTLTQPLLLTAKNKLFNRRIRLGSDVSIKVGTEITIQNRDIDEATKNALKGSSVSGVEIKMHKHNEDVNLPARVLVASSTDVEVTSDNTIVWNFDTTDLRGKRPGDTYDEGEEVPIFDDDDLGSRTGTYSIQVSYDLIDQHIVSPLFYLIIS